MKNNLQDLNDYLFQEIEELQDNDGDLDRKIAKSKAVANIAQTIINNAELALNAKKYIDEMGGEQRSAFPKMLSMEKK